MKQKYDANPMQKAHAAPRCTAHSKRTGLLCKSQLSEGGTCAGCTVHVAVKAPALTIPPTNTGDAHKNGCRYAKLLPNWAGKQKNWKGWLGKLSMAGYLILSDCIGWGRRRFRCSWHRAT